MCLLFRVSSFFLTSSREVAYKTWQPHDCDLPSKTSAGIVAHSSLSILKIRFSVLCLLRTELKNETLVSLTGSLIYSVISETSCSLFLSCSWPNTRSSAQPFSPVAALRPLLPFQPCSKEQIITLFPVDSPSWAIFILSLCNSLTNFPMPNTH